MANVFLTADTHFNHEMLLAYRPFNSVEEMNEAIIDRWNATVTRNDVVWHLGDVAMGNRQEFLDEILPRLNGKVHLITGNHDPCWSGHRNAHKHQAAWINAGFWSVQAFARKKIGDQSVMLSHFPYSGDHTEQNRHEQYRLLDDGLFLLHGHVHDKWQVKGRQINVGVDVWNFFPVPLETIRGIINA